MFNPDLDAKNTLPFLAYTNPTAYQHLIQLTVRKCDSYDCLPFKADLDAIFDVLGIQNTYAINYRSDNVGHWSTRHGGERVVLNDGRTFPVPQFRYIDFLNVLLGSYRAGTSVALTDKNQNTKKENHKNAIRNIRIDFQFDTYSGIAATRLAIELRTKLATVGLDSFFVISGGIGVQVIIPLPCTLTMESARRLWVRLQPYLETESATLIKCSVRDFLRLPLGRDAQTGLIGLYFSPEDEMYVSPLEQISYFLKSWKWTNPSHINNAINESTFFEESKKGFSFIPEPKFVTVVDSPKCLNRRSEQWSNQIWALGQDLKTEQWTSYLYDHHALQAAYCLYGVDACNKLVDVARQNPALHSLEVTDRISKVSNLWQTFVKVQPPSNSSEILALMLTTVVSEDTQLEADSLFEYIESKIFQKGRWCNQNVRKCILAIIHGISCSRFGQLFVSFEDLLKYLHMSGLSSMTKKRLVSIIEKTTKPHPVVLTRNMTKALSGNPFAVFYHDVGNRICNKESLDAFSRIPGINRQAFIDEQDELKEWLSRLTS